MSIVQKHKTRTMINEGLVMKKVNFPRWASSNSGHRFVASKAQCKWETGGGGRSPRKILKSYYAVVPLGKRHFLREGPFGKGNIHFQ